MTPEQAEQRLRGDFMAYVKHPVDECGYEGGCAAARYLDRYAAFIRVCAVAAVGCVEPFCAKEDMEGAYQGYWHDPGRWYTSCGNCPSCQAEAERDAMIRALEAE